MRNIPRRWKYAKLHFHSCEVLLIKERKSTPLVFLYFHVMSNQTKHMLQHAIFFALFLCAANSFAQIAESPAKPVLLRYSVVHVFPHDTTHFTEGLALHDGKILESAGRYGLSSLYETDLATGRVLREHRLAARYFGEGMTVANNRIVQLTWREHTGFVYDLAFKRISSFSYPTEGWGLANFNRDRELVMSDGSAKLHFLSADDFHPLREVTVHAGDHKITQINELEAAKGFIYANIWTTELIVVIDPSDGAVRAWLDLSALKQRLHKPKDWNEQENVLNGIAYDPRSGHFFVTGKCWPSLFEIAIEKFPTENHPAGTATPQ
ncbi:MAG: glutaminyl-peptide cyclotransferase [Stenotrophobium sp.]